MDFNYISLIALLHLLFVFLGQAFFMPPIFLPHDKSDEKNKGGDGNQMRHSVHDRVPVRQHPEGICLKQDFGSLATKSS